MRVKPIEQIKEGERFAQNIFRHDGLLAFAKGTTVRRIQKEALAYLRLEYVMVYDERMTISPEDTNFTLQVLESAYHHAGVWESSFGMELYQRVSARIIRNKKVCQYLNRLRTVDSYSFAQCINISMVIAMMLTKQQQVDEALADITYLTLIHDIGRIEMGGIFEKEGQLTEKEFEMIRKHPEVSFKLLKKAGLSPYDIQFVLETHEKYDGSGYPRQLSGTDITDLAQLISIAEVYNAMSSYRPYRNVFRPYEVAEVIEAEKDKAFGHHYVQLFVERFRPYQEGVMVEMDDGNRGIIRRVSDHYSLLPVVEIISEQTGERIDVWDLRYHPKRRIVRIINE